MTPPDDTPTMRAISPSAWGPAELLTEVQVPRPVPGPTEILVRVHAAGVNPTDWKQRVSGGLGMWGDPPILGYDVSGVVEAVGLGVALFAVGDPVFGMPEFPRQAGAYAEYVAAPAHHFAPKPGRLDHVHAAALPLAGLTAWQFLVELAEVSAGQRVLVHAAAGGVGHLAVQIAKAQGAYVIGTASAAKHAGLIALGLDEAIDYRTSDFAAGLRDVDVVLDTIGGDYAARSLPTLRRGGLLLSLASPFDPDPDVVQEAERLGIRTAAPLVEPDGGGMRALAGLVEQGRLRPEVGTVLPLEQAAEAHRLGEEGAAAGKIVLTVSP